MSVSFLWLLLLQFRFACMAYDNSVIEDLRVACTAANAVLQAHAGAVYLQSCTYLMSKCTGECAEFTQDHASLLDVSAAAE